MRHHTETELRWHVPEVGGHERVGAGEQVIRDERALGTLIVVVSHDDSVGKRLGARRVRIEAGRIAHSD